MPLAIPLDNLGDLRYPIKHVNKYLQKVDATRWEFLCYSWKIKRM